MQMASCLCTQNKYSKQRFFYASFFLYLTQTHPYILPFVRFVVCVLCCSGVLVNMCLVLGNTVTQLVCPEGMCWQYFTQQTTLYCTDISVLGIFPVFLPHVRPGSV